jgi:hypothetical protein
MGATTELSVLKVVAWSTSVQERYGHKNRSDENIRDATVLQRFYQPHSKFSAEELCVHFILKGSESILLLYW